MSSSKFGGTHYIFCDDHIGELVTDCELAWKKRGNKEGLTLLGGKPAILFEIWIDLAVLYVVMFCFCWALVHSKDLVFFGSLLFSVGVEEVCGSVGGLGVLVASVGLFVCPSA